MWLVFVSIFVSVFVSLFVFVFYSIFLFVFKDETVAKVKQVPTLVKLDLDCVACICILNTVTVT